MEATTGGPDSSLDANPAMSALAGRCLCGAVTITVAAGTIRASAPAIAAGIACAWALRSEIYADRAMARSIWAESTAARLGANTRPGTGSSKATWRDGDARVADAAHHFFVGSSIPAFCS